MDNKNFEHVVDYILREEPECADDLVYALELVKSCFEGTENKIKENMSESLAKSKFAEIREQSIYCEEIDALISDIDSQINYMIQFQKKEPSEPLDPKPPIDYEQYTTDRMVPHVLGEDFEHKRPCAFKFRGRMVQVASWQDIIVQICGILAELDPDKMHKLTEAESMQGRKLKYITETPTLRKTKRIPGTDLYVWINNSANVLMNTVQRIFKEYGISDDEIVIFLRADYTPLHE